MKKVLILGAGMVVKPIVHYLLNNGIAVTIASRTVEKADKVYQGFDALRAEDIADIIQFVISRPYHVNIADLVVMSTAQASSTIVNRR